MIPTFEQWVKNDQKLNDLLVKIQSIEESTFQQAEMAFNELCNLYDLPKMPEDLICYEALSRPAIACH
ncbi:hypothetical protein G7074_24050 [Pedobacter sp. HDW13]|uniref:hypothetical protein n=1 Tax=unclassified Pedobacter TaxID=2628915 RepID=UPI000F5B74A4|nr:MULTISPECIES: hypothetical protein [unclassified Pedobacter]QIL42068.1 hypothetical protein G7074_24050 [Pedobacter sp. HDW13]RQO76699.1 hypothetical protein DBR40_12485 [Pedobacter sp. KBW01]